MFRIWLLLLAGAAPLAAQVPSASQITVTPVRIGGQSPADWSIGDGGPATDALLSPSALAWDRAGNLLIADSRNQSIRRLTPAGVISTLFNQDGVASMAVDSKGNLYVSAVPNSYPYQGRIFEFAPDGSKTEIPNPGSPNAAPAMAIDAADNLYLTDELAQGGGFVWRRSSSGSVQKIAGSPGPPGTPPSQGGPALQVTLDGPHALAFDRSGNLLIADYTGVLRLNPDGTLVRLFQDGAPVRIAPAADGSIYFLGGSYGIGRWDPAGGLASFAGTSQSGFSDGCALSGGKRVAKYASFSPSDLVLDTAGRLYVADYSINSGPESFYSYFAGRVRRIDPDGSIRTVAGAGSMPHESMPGGPALGAIFHNPEALAVDGAGNLFLAESSAGHVHEITAAGLFLTVAGTNSPPAEEDPACYPPAGQDVLSSPGGLAVDTNGNLYISDSGNHRIRRRSVDGTITTIAGTGVEGQTGDGGPAAQAEISAPTAIAVKPDGSIYFVTNYKVRSIRTDGVIDSPETPQDIEWLTVEFDGRLILSGPKLYKESADGSFYALRAGVGQVAADPAGAIYGIPFQAGLLLRTSPNCNVAEVASFQIAIRQSPQGLTGDSAGNLHLSADNSVWRIAPIAPPGMDTPSVYLDALGVFNAASSLTAFVPPPPNCIDFHSCGLPWSPVNDSVTGNEILRITGGCLGPLEPLNATFGGGRLPTSLQGTQVLFDGEAAPLVSVQATEILAIAPQDVASKSSVTLAVVNQGVQASTMLPAATAVPGIFVTSGTQAAAINEDGSINGPDHPAPVGSIVSLFVTGADRTDPLIGDGVAPTLPLPQLALPVAVKVGGAAADVLYAGSALGLAGLAQLNVRIPTVAASDAVPVQVAVGGISRNQMVTIAVQ